MEDKTKDYPKMSKGEYFYWNVSEMFKKHGDMVKSDWEGFTDVRELQKQVVEHGRRWAWFFKDEPKDVTSLIFDLVLHYVYEQYDQTGQKVSAEAVDHLIEFIWSIIRCNHWMCGPQDWSELLGLDEIEKELEEE
jgi:hypothetical protein